MDYLFALTEALSHQPDLQQLLVSRPNSSLYRAAGRLRHAEARLDGKNRSYHQVTVEETGPMSAALLRAGAGARLGELAALLVSDTISPAAARAHVRALAEEQILVPEIALRVTGSEPVHSLTEQLAGIPEAKENAENAETLERTRAGKRGGVQGNETSK